MTVAVIAGIFAYIPGAALGWHATTRVHCAHARAPAAITMLETACRTGLVPSITMIPPSLMVVALVDPLRSGKFATNIFATLSNVAIAIILSMLAGVLVGTILHSRPAARRILDPLFATYYAVPMYAFYPLLIVVLGLGDLPQVAIGFLLAVMAVIINTLNGQDRVPQVLLKAARVHRLNGIKIALRIHPIYLRTARTLKFSQGDVARKILIPAALPEIVTVFVLGFR